MTMQQASHPAKHYWRIDEAADYFRKSDKTIRRWIANGDLDAHRLKSGRLLVPSSAVRAVVRLDCRCYEHE